MNTEIIWFVITLVSVPAAGILGYSLQRRKVNLLQLENEKLRRDNLALKATGESKAEAKASVDEMGAATGRAQESIGEDVEDFLLKIDWRDKLFQLCAFLFLCYFIYDIYRLGSWLYSFI
ncbi:hypothetical protein [Shewanella atlantica]|uniref:hypothetical protein n=1 Tax=Shewanella atlantica TaxID=271099 RepID=UPI003735A313